MPDLLTVIRILLDLSLFAVIMRFCWRGYRKRLWWPRAAVLLLFRLLAGRGFWIQLFTLGPLTMLWMIICRAVNGLGWHATAAGGVVLGFTLVLDAMRMVEENQKAQRTMQQPGEPPSSDADTRPQGRNEP